ncbi:hypothetical protein D3C74_502690 [compost metagenome]
MEIWCKVVRRRRRYRAGSWVRTSAQKVSFLARDWGVPERSSSIEETMLTMLM